MLFAPRGILARPRPDADESFGRSPAAHVLQSLDQRRPMILFRLLSAVHLLAIAPPSVGAQGPQDPFDERALAQAIWQAAPEVLAARQEVVDAEALRGRTYLLPNPSLTATWGTIPIGERNPPALAWSKVPNYSVGVSELFELGKRGPRQQAAEANRTLTHYALLEVYVRNFFEAMEAMSEQAAATARIALLERLVAESQEILRLQRARSDKGDVAPLEVDRLEVENLRLLSSLRQAEATREAAMLACSRVLVSGCARFADVEQAQRFLAQRTAEAPTDQMAANARPDVQALLAERNRLRAELTLAERQKIPDPVASVGFMHDQFVVSGNQSNSLNVSVTVPLPIFDHGQVEAARARSRLAVNDTATRMLTQSVSQSLAIGRKHLEILTGRARSLDKDALPRARNVVDRMEGAARRGGVAVQDVLLARRALEELQLDRVDVASEAHRVSLHLRRASASVPWPESQSR